MEKRKLLLVAISVGLFLVVSIVAAIMIFQPGKAPAGIAGSGPLANGPNQGTQPGAYSVTPPSYQIPPTGYTSLDAVDMVRNPSELPGLRPAPEGMSRQNNDFHVSGSGISTETVISVPRPSTVAVPDTPPATPRTERAVAAPSTPRPATPAPQTTAAVQRPAPQTRVYNDFWVQTGAFSTIAKAEGVKETLTSKGITSIIENRDIDGRTLFRVRVGPYTSQNEANYWLSLIKSISGFEDSQIRQTQSRR